MKRKLMIAILVSMLLPLLGACEPWNDAWDELFGEDEKEERHRQPYQDIPAFTNGRYGLLIDPYDGSVDRVDPAGKSRVSIPTSPDPKHAAVIDDGAAFAVLDNVQHIVRIIDVAAARVTKTIAVGEAVNRLIANPYGGYLLAIYDPAAGEVDFGESGMINYYKLDILDLASLERQTVSIDFTPDNIIFNPDGRTCLLGRDYRLVHLEMDTVQTVSYPLSLGPGDPRTPTRIAISPDGEFVIILVSETLDVYVIDLVGQSINILDLSGKADDIQFIPETRIALLPLSATGSIAVVDLDQATPETIDIDAFLERVLISEDGRWAALYGLGESRIVVLDLEEFEAQLFPLDVAVNSYLAAPVAFAPDNERLLVIGYGEVTNDIDIVDLNTNRVIPLGFEGEIADYAFSDRQPSLGVLLHSAQKFVRVNLETLDAQSWPIGQLAERLYYLPEVERYMVDYDHRSGKLSFMGDLGSDFFWIADRLFDR